MAEDLLRQILEELRNQQTPAWLEALKLIVPPLVGLLGGLFAAGVGFYAVRHSGETQLALVERGIVAQQSAEAAARRTAWRQARYGELQTSLGEYLAALRSWSVAMNRWVSSFSNPQEASWRDLFYGEFVTAANRLRQVDLASGVFRAIVRIDDKGVADQANEIIVALLTAQQGGPRIGMSAGAALTPDELQQLEKLTQIQDDAYRKIFDLNRKIEDMISEG